MTLPKQPAIYDVMRARGVSRRTFLSFCTKATALAGLSSTMLPKVVKAFSTKPRIPVIWLHGLECTGCSESLLRSSNPLIGDVLLDLISLEYHHTLQAAAGEQAEDIRRQVMAASRGEYLLAVEGAVPTSGGGVHCTVEGRSFQSILQETAAQALAVIACGACACNGGVQGAAPNPTGSKPVSSLIRSKPIIAIPGCPPVAEVMTGVIAFYLTNERLPDLDSSGRPLLYYGTTVHELCARKPYYEARQFVRKWDDAGARSGWCLYHMGCRGPNTHNACSEMGWNEGVSFCMSAGHPCIGCSERGFWNKPIYPAARRRDDDHDRESRHED